MNEVKIEEPADRLNRTPRAESGSMYRGWLLGWTGWKGRHHPVTEDSLVLCSKCGKLFVKGESMYVRQGVRDVLCVPCDGHPNYVVGQWTGWLVPDRQDLSTHVYLEVCAGNAMGLFAHEYKRGESFPVEFSSEFTVDTEQDKLDGECTAALAVLKAEIDKRSGEYE